MVRRDQYLAYTRRKPRTSARALISRIRRLRLTEYAIRFANRPPNQTAVIMGIATALVIAALTVPTSLTVPPPAPPAGWETFDTASQMVQPLVATTAGGPWNISLAEGVAAVGPWSPTLSMWGLNASWAPTIASCQSLLFGNSLFTFWNSSEYPAATGSPVFASGGAGLWTFVYLNDTGGSLVMSVIDNQAQLNGVLPADSPCAQFGGPFTAQTSYLNPTNVSDPSSFASTAYQEITTGLPSARDPTTAFYILGNPALPVSFLAPGYNQEWSTYYGTCGAPGVQGRVTYDGAPQVIPHHPGFLEQVTVGNYCYQNLDGITPGPRSLWSLDGTFYASWPVSVLLDSSTRSATASSIPPLNTSMFHMAVMLNSGLGPFSSAFTSGQPQCTVGTTSLPACTGEPRTWYAVLLNPSGTIVDTYPVISGAPTWTIGNVTVATNDQLVLVSPIPVFSLPDSGLEFISGWNPYVCCGIDFGPSTVQSGGPFVL
jgi:hypothetical protein